MIRNMIIKNALINTVFSGLSVLNRAIKKKDDTILLYSDTSFRDNNRYLYDYLISNGYEDKYSIICACKDYKQYERNGKNRVRFVSPLKGVMCYLISGHVFYSFGKIPIKPSEDQIVIQMWHGTSFKGFAENQKKTCSVKKQFYTYVYASSEYFVPIVEKKFQVDRERIVICGHPRTDVLFQSFPSYDFGKFNKILIWLPTFRRSKELGLVDGKMDSIVPVIENEELEKLDGILAERNVKLIVKLHPEQDVDGAELYAMQNLHIMTHEEFAKKRYDLYALMRCADALITDYSSVFYDYLLLNRPIGFTDDDIEDYGNRRGFAVEDPNKFRPGKRLRTFDDVVQFINNVCDGTDEYKKERESINDIANFYHDAGNCERTLRISNITLKTCPEISGGGV